MPKRSFISSSRLAGSAVLWTALAVMAVEVWCGRTFPSRYFSHEVDVLLEELRTTTYDANTIVLGDSVGRQISRFLVESGEKDFLPLATNGAMQMAGQYYVFMRYLERNRPPRTVILMMHRPLHGNLNQVETENYVQRSFTRWKEIAEMTWQTGRLGFGVRSMSYRFATAKYRGHILKEIPGLEEPPIRPIPKSEWGPAGEITRPTILQKAIRRFSARKISSVSEYYLLKFLDECRRRNIRVCYVPCPMPERQWARYQNGPAQTQLVPRMKELAREYPNLAYTTDLKIYPGKWFVDGIHVESSRLPEVARDHARLMDELMSP